MAVSLATRSGQPWGQWYWTMMPPSSRLWTWSWRGMGSVWMPQGAMYGMCGPEVGGSELYGAMASLKVRTRHLTSGACTGAANATNEADPAPDRHRECTIAHPQGRRGAPPQGRYPRADGAISRTERVPRPRGIRGQRRRGSGGLGPPRLR